MPRYATVLVTIEIPDLEDGDFHMEDMKDLWKDFPNDPTAVQEQVKDLLEDEFKGIVYYGQVQSVMIFPK